MDCARERGITLFDTATNYSAGASETIIGHWLKSRQPDPNSLTVTTKIYPPFTAQAINVAVAASAERLGVSTIDVLYLHKWDETAATAECVRALDLLIRDHRVRALGASNFDGAQLKTTLELQERLGLARFVILQNNNNLAIRDVDNALVDLCTQYHVAITTYSPLGAGFLTGKHREGVQPGSRFAVSPGHQAVYFNAVAERRLNKLSEVAAHSGHSMTLLALAWALHHRGVSTVLIGGRAPRHLDQAIAALAIDAPDLFAELETV